MSWLILAILCLGGLVWALLPPQSPPLIILINFLGMVVSVVKFLIWLNPGQGD